MRAIVAIFLIGTFLLSAVFYLVPEAEIYFGRGVLSIAALVAVVQITILRALFLRLIFLFGEGAGFAGLFEVG